MTTAGGRRVVVATPDTIAPGMAGPAIRAWRLAAELAKVHEVRLVTSSTCALAEGEGFVASAVTEADIGELEQWCDVIVSQGFFLHQHPALLASNRVLVVDMYDPLHLEQLEQARDEGEERRYDIVDRSRAVLNEQLLRGDFFMCASAKQRDFWLGHLSALGRINPRTYDEDATLCDLIDVVPFGIDARPPVHTRQMVKGVIPGVGTDDPVVLWGGGIYNWLDPLSAIRAVDKLRARLPAVRLVFMGLRHPNPDIPQMQMAVAARALSDDLELTDRHVFFNEGWVPFDERQNFLLEADVGISTHVDHLETAYSFRTRVLDYLWAGLPVVATAGDTLSDLIESRGLGVTVAAGDAAALEDALFSLLTDADRSARCRRAIAEVVPDLVWPRVAEPLLRFCASPRRAPDLVDPGARRRLQPSSALARVASTPLRRRLRRVPAVWREGGWRGVVARVMRPSAK